MKLYIVELYFSGNFMITRPTLADSEAIAVAQVMDTHLFDVNDGFYYPRHLVVKARAYEEKVEERRERT